MAEKEYIEREAFIEILKKTKKDCEHYADKVCCDFAIKMVNLMPSADVQEVRHGKWQGRYNINNIYNDWYCNECGYYSDIRNKNNLGNYCPNCGVKMDKEFEE